MNKTISSITPTPVNHPFVGKLYSVIFSNGDEVLMYEETFYHHFKDYDDDVNTIIGRELDPSKPIFD